MAVKKAVKNIAMTNTLINPHINDTDSIFLPQLRQTATNTGKTGSMHGDITDIAPVKNEKMGRISIHIPFSFSRNSSGGR
jgi:hypothetical protein|nr:hypothetical protein [Methanosphaera sp. BMS]